MMKDRLLSIWWWIEYWFWSKPPHLVNKYRRKRLLIKSLNNQWMDMSELILHAAFACLTQYVEDEGGLHKGWTEETEVIQDEIAELYYWWTVERPTREYDDYSHPAIEIPDEHGCSHSPEDQEDTDKLIQLIKIRGFLWT